MERTVSSFVFRDLSFTIYCTGNYRVDSTVGRSQQADTANFSQEGCICYRLTTPGYINPSP